MGAGGGRKARGTKGRGPESLTSEEVSYIEEGAGTKGRDENGKNAGAKGAKGERREARGERREARGERPAKGLTSEEVSYIKKKTRRRGDAGRRCC